MAHSGHDHGSHAMMDHSSHQAMMNHSNNHAMVMDHSSMGHHSMDYGSMDHGSMDHGSMDHGSMDHGSMDHGSMDHGSMSHMMGHMDMSFHFSCESTILFDFWKTSTVEGLIFSMVGIFILAALYEGLKYYREYLFWKAYNALQYRSVQMPIDKNSTDSSNRVVHVVGEVIHKQPPSMMSTTHVIQTILHIVQITLSYFLMLIFMTYNVWLCIAVVLGAATGYFLFGWKKSVIVDVTEHCH